MHGASWLGWVSSLLLVCTIGSQVFKQWHEGASEGVSPWLLVGQCAASIGFVAYSWTVGDPVFVVTNAVMFASAVLGLVVLLRNRSRLKRERRAPHASRASIASA